MFDSNRECIRCGKGLLVRALLGTEYQGRLIEFKNREFGYQWVHSSLFCRGCLECLDSNRSI